MAGAGLKLLPPDKCDGDSDFDRFTKLLCAYMGCQDNDYVHMMTSPQTAAGIEIGTAALDTLDQAFRQRGREEGQLAILNTRLYYVLISLTDKAAFTIVDNVQNSNGMEAWRRLRERYSRTNQQKSIMSLVAIMGMKLPDDNSLEQKFVNFEVEMNRYEMATGNQLPDSAKVGILVATTTGRLHEHLVLNMSDQTTYAQVRVTIMNYVKSKKRFD